MNIKEGDHLLCYTTRVLYFTAGKTYIVYSHNPGSADKRDLYLQDEKFADYSVYGTTTGLVHKFIQDNFQIVQSAKQLQSLSQTLIPGDIIQHINASGGKVLLQFVTQDYTTQLFHFCETSTGIKSCYSCHWIDSFCHKYPPPQLASNAYPLGAPPYPSMPSHGLPLYYRLKVSDEIMYKGGDSYLDLNLTAGKNYKIHNIDQYRNTVELLLPKVLATTVVGRDSINQYFDESKPQLTPAGLSAQSHPLVNNPWMQQIINGTVDIDKPKIHKTCRACGNEGSHNTVNHKEYYYCKVCKEEC